MFNNTTLSEILKLIPREKFKSLVEKYGSDRYTKRFKTWDHLVTLLTAQLSGAKSLRDLETLVNHHPESHYHLNLSSAKLSRSTISDANQRLKPDVFRDLASSLMVSNRKAKRELSNLITILDSSPILIRGRGSEWAEATKVRSNKGLKLHVQYEHTLNNIEYIEMTNSNVNDLTVAQRVPLVKDRIYVFDRAYCEYNWWDKIGNHGSKFVTRLKIKSAYKVLENLTINSEDKGFILKDQLITLTNKFPRANRKNNIVGKPLRLVKIVHPKEPKKDFLIVSNAIHATAAQIAGWYKERWAIELLFKWLKGNLKLTHFLGESRNAIMLQIYVAIIAFLLLQAYHRCSYSNTYRLKDVTTLVKAQLFMRPRLTENIYKRRMNEARKSPQITMVYDL